MIAKCDVKTAGLTLGFVFAIWHFVWVVLVQALGDTFIGWVQQFHFIRMAASAMPFDIVTFIVGLVGAFATGAVTGAMFAVIWNKLSR